MIAERNKPRSESGTGLEEGAGVGGVAGVRPDEHTSRTSLDWAGTYEGIVPCADCEGIETTILLTYDDAYILRTKYLGKDERVFERSGAVVWSDDGGSIRLGGVTQGPDRYLVGENVLIQLDREGNRITGDLAQSYRLAKVR
ncbi:MAG: copper resistance protein NlpE [Candidatus Eisenbacteria bacterium]